MCNVDEGCRLLLPHSVCGTPHDWEPQPVFWTYLLYSSGPSAAAGWPLLASASINLQPQTCCSWSAFPPLEKSCIGCPFSWEASRGVGCGVCFHPAVRCRLSADVLFVLWSGQSTGQKLHLTQHYCQGWCPRSHIWGWCSLVSMQAALVALTLLLHLALSHVHTDMFPFILYS